MTGMAYRRSAELAGVVGAYDGYARNATPHQRVMRKHAAAATSLKPQGAVATASSRRRTKQWQAATARREATAGATRRPACSPRPAPSAS